MREPSSRSESLKGNVWFVCLGCQKDSILWSMKAKPRPPLRGQRDVVLGLFVPRRDLWVLAQLSSFITGKQHAYQIHLQCYCLLWLRTGMTHCLIFRFYCHLSILLARVDWHQTKPMTHRIHLTGKLFNHLVITQ